MFEKLLRFYLSIGPMLMKVYRSVLWFFKYCILWGLRLVLPIAFFWLLVGWLSDKWEFRDNDPSRAVAAISGDPIDTDVAKENISYLEQNWSPSDSLWFYNATQGSNLLPYDFFLHLEQADSTELFRSNENINRYRYLPQEASKLNPDALPVGMTMDSYQGKDYLGFTCAACHTSQINYLDQDKVAHGIRIDGGPAAADLEGFLVDMVAALEATLAESDKRQRFYTAVLEKGDYGSRAEVERDLQKYTLQIKDYTEVNAPYWQEGATEQQQTHYGYARLDAFGRIYNRVLQYIIGSDRLAEVLARFLPDSVRQAAAEQLSRLYQDPDQRNLMLRAMQIIKPHLQKLGSDTERQVLTNIREEIYNPANAPASYPYLWDIAQHDYVQWTGLVSNGGIGPLGRNVGQVIGVFGTLDWQHKPGWSVSSFIAGQGFERGYVDFRSSIDKRNLGRVEHHLRKLWSPLWPDQLGQLDWDKVAAGETLFQQRCAGCHANIRRTDPERRVIANLTKLESVGTDPQLAKNSTTYKGNSGLIEGEYVEAGSGLLVIEKHQPVASLVKFSTKNVVTAWDPDKWPVRRVAEWSWDTLKAARNNNIKTTLRRGNYESGTTANPFKPLNSYKARSLNGIWATAPYLHNGSVPNLYELLLPKKRPGDPDVDEQGNAIEYRSDRFLVGSREFDSRNVGFRQTGYPANGFMFDTSLPGNSNAGHEYAAGRTADASGKLFEPLNRQQRYQLVEYMKSIGRSRPR